MTFKNTSNRKLFSTSVQYSEYSSRLRRVTLASIENKFWNISRVCKIYLFVFFIRPFCIHEATCPAFDKKALRFLSLIAFIIQQVCIACNRKWHTVKLGNKNVCKQRKFYRRSYLEIVSKTSLCERYRRNLLNLDDVKFSANLSTDLSGKHTIKTLQYYILNK